MVSESPSPQKGLHDWYLPRRFTYPICRRCGVVQRRDGKNKPCKGPTRLREMGEQMSTGMVICSRCGREVHQWGDTRIRRGWIHCNDRTEICDLASAVYPLSADDVRGAFCCADGPLPTQKPGVEPAS